MSNTTNFSAETLFDETISKYNSEVNEMSKFQFSEREKKMFLLMMETHALHAIDELLTKQKEQQFKVGDKITNGSHFAKIEYPPALKADIVWLHNDAVCHDVDLTYFKKAKQNEKQK